MTRRAAADRREEIIAATVDVLLAKGLGAATTRDVTDAIGVGAGLLSHYFRWSELRALAFDRVVLADLERSLLGRTHEPAAVVMKQLSRETFDLELDPVWRVWIEAVDLASTDPLLAERVRACTEQWRAGLADLIQRGTAEGQWSCADPHGASWRLLALLDGLLGLMLLGSLLSRRQAATHWRVAVAHECNSPVRGSR